MKTYNSVYSIVAKDDQRLISLTPNARPQRGGHVSNDAHNLARAVSHLARRLRLTNASTLTQAQLSALHTISALGSASPSAIPEQPGVPEPVDNRAGQHDTDAERARHQ